MKYKNIIIEENEYLKIEKLLNLNNKGNVSTVKSYISKLQDELKTAIILPESEIPKDVIKLNSVVTIKAKNTLWERTFELVLPAENNHKESKVSLLLPMGAAILGYAKGDVILWDFPKGLQELNVLDVVQQSNNSKK
ncbi:GreA/GreB family elongation factor [Tenacibaculum aquimarinum]|uniref:GreA/GreB family elongation factor n=1 Tax=Tenacibaculum aquimarinum TaxID=2910675 RepID=UPI001F0AAA96|nr:GreA/GreB family elongation factor [Tenacibaculum aquimarinum]MCH3885022.1 GreA/GreB family elongation factor [Tenacibaculum aquimarinum]